MERTKPTRGAPETGIAAFYRTALEIDEAEDSLLRQSGATTPAEEKAEYVDAFYEHLLSFPETDRILRAEPDRVDRLRSAMKGYVESFMTAPIDDAYIADRTRVGEVHHRIGLQPRWYLTGYGFFVSWWLPRVGKGVGGPARSRAFLKRVLLDVALAMESYVAGRVDESEQRYEDLVENAPEMIHQVDAERRFTGVNRTELGRLGYALDEMRRMRLEEIVPPAYRRGVLDHLERVRADGTSQVETVFRTKSGDEFPVEIYAMAQFGADGAYLQARAFVRDLSERRRLERELLKWERLAAVGSVAAKVAHEIRNPLSAISLNAELLGDEVARLKGEHRSEGERLLATILSEVDRLNAVIEEYLAFARLPRLTVGEVSLQEVFYRLEDLLGNALERRGIQLVVALGEDVPRVSGDGRQLEQAFLNLLRNAEDALPRGGEIRVRARDLSEGVEVSIADTGVGIPEKSLPLIFDPFFTTKDAGTGLGLAFVQQVVREHGGRIVCKSSVGEGTEFVLTLPRADGKTARPWVERKGNRA